ncbi:hypothetical protein F7725_009760 [Dissostichus mawsoni]|uniref:Uncharacterized protein n=1 Tax=Dissostichus mawsoni TaxID=36200 RepID=A0A7J5XLM6_DISMA|nr:hypothetical protein F7725_009760 [Dissostichus mawsoni]
MSLAKASRNSMRPCAGRAMVWPCALPNPGPRLTIHVIFPILPHQEFALERPPRLILHYVRVARAQLGVMFDKVPEIIAELYGHRHRESEAALVSTSPDLGYL